MAAREIRIAPHAYELANHRWRPKAVLFYTSDEIADILYFPDHTETYGTERDANEAARDLARSELRRRGDGPTRLEAMLEKDRPLLQALSREDRTVRE